jgi:hypothetical protein
VLPFALYALWLMRRRPALLFPVLALALSATLVFTAEGATRYRGPLDPFIAVIASYAIATLLARFRERRSAAAAPTQPLPAPPAA